MSARRAAAFTSPQVGDLGEHLVARGRVHVGLPACLGTDTRLSPEGVRIPEVPHWIQGALPLRPLSLSALFPLPFPNSSLSHFTCKPSHAIIGQHPTSFTAEDLLDPQPRPLRAPGPAPHAPAGRALRAAAAARRRTGCTREAPERRGAGAEPPRRLRGAAGTAAPSRGQRSARARCSARPPSAPAPPARSPLRRVRARPRSHRSRLPVQLHDAPLQRRQLRGRGLPRRRRAGGGGRGAASGSRGGSRSGPGPLGRPPCASGPGEGGREASGGRARVPAVPVVWQLRGARGGARRAQHGKGWQQRVPVPLCFGNIYGWTVTWFPFRVSARSQVAGGV